MSIERRKQVDRNSLAYLTEAAKLDFALELSSWIQKLSMTQKQLAEKVGVKPPYLTRVLRGDENLTVATMVKLAEALGKRLNIHLSDRDCSVRWVEVVRHGEVRGSSLSKVGAWKSFGQSSSLQQVDNVQAANDYETESIAA